MTLYSAYAGWRKRKLLLAILAGFSFVCGLLMSFGILALLPLLLIWAALGVKKQAKPVSSLATHLAAAISGGVLAFAVFSLVTGSNPVSMMSSGLLAHRALERSYWKWALFDPIEFACFLGIPIAIWLIVSLLSKTENTGRSDRLLLAWLITFALLDLSGIVRGEVGRIWLFLMFPPVIGAAAFLSERATPRAVWGLLFFALFLQTYQMKANLGLFSLF